MRDTDDRMTEPVAIFLPWQVEEIKKAIAEADAGDFASDEEVESMFDELTR